jgi:hypothetical protein
MSWRVKIRDLRLPQTVIAELLGRHKATVSQDLAGAEPPASVRAVIAAWEIMTPDQRAAWLAELGVAADRPKRGRPRLGTEKPARVAPAG